MIHLHLIVMGHVVLQKLSGWMAWILHLSLMQIHIAIATLLKKNINYHEE